MSGSGEPRKGSGEPLLRVRGLKKHFVPRGGLFGGGGEVIRAVDGVDLDLRRGETLGLVGESGSGKSTTGRSVLRLVEPTAGSVRFDGHEVTEMGRKELLAFRRRAQIVFQDPFGTLNPRMRIGAALREALQVHGLAGRGTVARRVAELLETVGLRAEHADRFPHEFSGGQRQRVGIARALAVQPDLVVCDEPVSALDVSVQAQILNLLADLQAELGLAFLLIAHDLAVVEHMSDRVAVMYAGRIVETGPSDRIYLDPRHPYTRSLLEAVPRPEPGVRRRRAALQGEPPGASSPASGCPFRPRCPHPDRDRECAEVRPPLEPTAPGHLAACLKERSDVAEPGSAGTPEDASDTEDGEA